MGKFDASPLTGKHCGTCGMPIQRHTKDYINSDMEDGMCAKCLERIAGLYVGRVIPVIPPQGKEQMGIITKIFELYPNGNGLVRLNIDGKEKNYFISKKKI